MVTEQEVDDFLEHFGKKGMKWGQRHALARAAKGPDRFGNRNTASVQRRVDVVRRVANGKGSHADMLKAGLLYVPFPYTVSEGFSVSGGSKRLLQQNKRIQKKIVAGKKNTTDILNRIGGVDIRELNYNISR